jgi:hypothetical protein
LSLHREHLNWMGNSISMIEECSVRLVAIFGQMAFPVSSVEAELCWGGAPKRPGPGSPGLPSSSIKHLDASYSTSRLKCQVEEAHPDTLTVGDNLIVFATTSPSVGTLSHITARLSRDEPHPAMDSRDKTSGIPRPKTSGRIYRPCYGDKPPSPCWPKEPWPELRSESPLLPPWLSESSSVTAPWPPSPSLPSRVGMEFPPTPPASLRGSPPGKMDGQAAGPPALSAGEQPGDRAGSPPSSSESGETLRSCEGTSVTSCCLACTQLERSGLLHRPSAVEPTSPQVSPISSPERPSSPSASDCSGPEGHHG